MPYIKHSTFLFVFLSFFVFHCFAQSRNPLFVVSVNGKHGYIDRTGKIVIPPKFDGALDFSEGLARIVVNDKWGFINRNGRIVIKPRFEYAQQFQEGLAMVQVNKGWKRNWGFIDGKGRMAIKPQFDELTGVAESTKGFVEGLAMVELDRYKGFIDRKGLLVIAPKYLYAYPFSNGLAAVTLGHNEKWGYIDKRGNWRIRPRYKWASLFSEGLAPVNLDDRCGFVDRLGRFLLHPFESRGDCPTIWGHFNGGLSRWKIDGLFGYINKNGEIVIKPELTLTDGFSEGMAKFTRNGKVGFIDTKGNIVVEPQFESARDFKDGLAGVSVKDGDNYKRGYIDKTGNYVWKPTR
jgi:hypothetical protein